MAEPSEGFFAGCALCTNQELNAATANETSLQNFYDIMFQRYNSNQVVGAGAVKNDFLKEVTIGNSKNLATFYSDLVIGISAVKAVRNFMATSSTYTLQPNAVPNAVYLTGTQWPKEVQQFKFAAFGMALSLFELQGVAAGRLKAFGACCGHAKGLASEQQDTKE